MSDSKELTLSEARKSGRLQEFISEQEAKFDSIESAEFEACIAEAVKPHRITVTV